jgi:CBS domain-containing membrane protein
MVIPQAGIHLSMSLSFQDFLPRPMAVSNPERIRAAAGGAVGIAITAFISLAIAQQFGLFLWLVAPLGASAVLVFAVPSSPLAQPWSVVGGNTVSAVCGLLMCNLIPDPVVAAALAVGGAIGVMFAMRCLHPPGGAMALLVVLTHTQAWSFALFPALTNSLLLVAAGVAYNRLTRKAYPHLVASAPAATPSGLMRISGADLAHALAEENEVQVMAPDTLSRILERSEIRAWQRIVGNRTCADIMTSRVYTAHFGTHLRDVWALFQAKDIKAIPVVDRKQRVHGIVTPALMEIEAKKHGGLKAMLAIRGGTHSDVPEAAVQIMSENYITARTNDHLKGLMPLFSKGDRRHVLVLDEHRKLVGILSSSDLMSAVFHAA